MTRSSSLEAPLGAVDTAWLHMERATNPMVVSGVVELDGVLPMARVLSLLERIVEPLPFRARIAKPSATFGRPRWEALPGFDVARYVEHVSLSESDDDALRRFVEGVVGRRLDDDGAAWRLYVIDRPGKGSVLLCRVHHAIADGFALLGVLLALCDEPPDFGIKEAMPKPASRRAIRGAVRALERMIRVPSEPKTSLRGALGTVKRVAWTQPIPLAELKQIGRRCSATINDVLVAIVAGGLRRYLVRRGDETQGLELHALVPVNLRERFERMTLGNRFGMVFLGLPMGIDDPVARVAEVKARMLRLKHSPEAHVVHALLSVVGHAPRAIEDLAISYFGSKASLILTNVPGPRARLRIGGHDVRRIVFWVPQSAQIGLGISILSYAGEVTIGVLADAARVPEPEALVRDIEGELAVLRRLTLSPS